MASLQEPSFSSPAEASKTFPQPSPQLALLDTIFPGFSVVSSIFQKSLGIDLNVYLPMFMFFAGLIFLWQYFSDYIWGVIETHLMSSVEIRTDDEIYVSHIPRSPAQ